LFVFKAYKEAHSKLRNSLYNAEDGQKNKLDGWIIYCELPDYTMLIITMPIQ